MNEIEDRIYDYILKYGLSSSSVTLIKDNMDNISSTFLTDMLVENVNLHIEYKLLLDFLPKIWVEDNQSSNLLTYISGILHRLLYLAREQPLGKNISNSYKKNLAFFHQKLCEFKSECLGAVDVLEQYQLREVDSFEELIITMGSLPKLSIEIIEMLKIMSMTFHQFAVKYNQPIKNIDELSLFLSRCLILWKLNNLTDSEFLDCLNKATEKYSGLIELEKFEKIMSLEVQNYQFLQYGLNRDALKFFVDSFAKFYDRKKQLKKIEEGN